jgi:flavin reductase (DIM6/NTAB) family NADH-FMN oxidoreductase RutF
MNMDPIKDTLRRMPYGFYAISSHFKQDDNIMVANWITQTSFSPRQVTLALQITSHSYELITKSKVFAINVFLQADQELIFPFTKSRSKNPDKMKDIEYTTAQATGCPIVSGAAAVLECKVINVFDTGGDHHLILGEVIASEEFKPGKVDDTLNLPGVGWSYAG